MCHLASTTRWSFQHLCCSALIDKSVRRTTLVQIERFFFLKFRWRRSISSSKLSKGETSITLLRNPVHLDNHEVSINQNHFCEPSLISLGSIKIFFFVGIWKKQGKDSGLRRKLYLLRPQVKLYSALWMMNAIRLVLTANILVKF